MFGKWHMGADMEPKPGFDHYPYEMRNLFEATSARRERERLERELARLAPLASVRGPIR